MKGKPCVLGAACAMLLMGASFAQTNVRTVSSPDGHIKAEVFVTNGSLRYRIVRDGQEVLVSSRLGILSDGIEYGKQVEIAVPVVHEINEEYRLLGGHSTSVNHALEGEIPATASGHNFWIDLHVANDGAAVRLRLPAKTGRRVEADRSSWNLTGNPVLWADPLNAAYEGQYRTTTLWSVGEDPIGLPVTAKYKDLYVTISEAGLRDYGDLAIKRGANSELNGYLYADPKGWVTDDEVRQPWRVTIIADDLTQLVNSTLIQNLNPPPDAALANADWIKPGRSTWQWLSSGAPVLGDQNQWIQWTKELGFEYYLIDEGWENWDKPWESLRQIVSDAKKQNVKVWVWVHSKYVKAPVERDAYFQQLVAAGVVGVKIDFPEECNREWSNWYYDTARDAAKFRLLVDFHGAVKPTGMERTWPNVLTREAVRGHEYQITRYHRRLDSAHDTILPFTRYVIGPADYTPTVLESRELQDNTWAHEFAQAIEFTSPFLCFGGNPKDLVSNPARDILTAIPSTWDETLVLPGSEPGKISAMARRAGEQWFVAILNGENEGDLKIPLTFLGSGKWRSSLLSDEQGAIDKFDRKDTTLTGGDVLKVHANSRGGFVGWFRK